MIDMTVIISVLAATIRTSTPLLLPALAALYAERAGVVCIGIEGKMLASAFASAAVAALTGSALIGLLAGMLIGIAFALLHGFASITHRGDQIVSGLAINFIASGLTVTLGNAWYDRGGQTPQLVGSARFSPITLPGADMVANIPVIGPIYQNIVSGHPLPVYIAIAAVPVTFWVLRESRFGLRLRAVGEYPAAVDTAGVSVAALRYRALIITGALCGVAGSYLSTALNAGFDREMTAGRGYLALAALIFSNWRPWPALLACLLFGFLDAMQIRLQGVPLFGVQIPVELIQALPFILTIILLAGLMGRAEPPAAAGIPYVKER